MRIVLRGLGTVILIAVLYLLFWPVDIEPEDWEPQPNPGFSGPYERNNVLAAATLLGDGLSVGPEDVTMGPDGLLYTGLADGRIVRLGPDGSGAEDFVDTGGRPLGMRFDAQGNLIVADAIKGLLSVSPEGAVAVLTDSVDGERMLFVDDLDIASDGTIWFSDASQRFGIEDNFIDLLEGRRTGRLVTYDPQTDETKVQLDGLAFSNGVALGPDDEYVLVNETFGYRITRLWLKGPQAGKSEIFIDNLPGLPDNIRYNHAGLFWVALPAPRTDELDALQSQPFVRKVIARLPEAMRPIPGEPYAWAIGVDTGGNVVANLQDGTGHYGFVTSVNQFGDRLFLGSVTMDSIARIAVPDGIASGSTAGIGSEGQQAPAAAAEVPAQ